MANDMTKETVGISHLAKRTIKDSVFTNLFKDKKYALQLYQALHPEDGKITEDEICIVTLENILVNRPYNDLGFIVGKRLLVMVEAQSTWSPNIIIRGLLYIAQTIQDYLLEAGQNIHKSKKITFPEPELFVLYTGTKKNLPKEICLSDEFFGGRQCSIEVRVKVICNGESGDIINQYVLFTQICQKQIDLYGRSIQAVIETIRICKSTGILFEYLHKHEKEVVDIMTTLFDQEKVIELYLQEERQMAIEQGIEQGIKQGIVQGIEQGIEQGIVQGKKQVFKQLLASGVSAEVLAAPTGMDVKAFLEWLETESE